MQFYIKLVDMGIPERPFFPTALHQVKPLLETMQGFHLAPIAPRHLVIQIIELSNTGGEGLPIYIYI